MYFYKITNFLNDFGVATWKGLDVEKNIIGSQVYPADFNTNNICLVANEENIKSNSNLVQITKQEYLTLKAEIEASYPTSQPKKEDLLEQRVVELENENLSLKSQLETQNQAIAEITMMIAPSI